MIPHQFLSRCNAKQPIQIIFTKFSKIFLLLLFSSENLFNSWLKNIVNKVNVVQYSIFQQKTQLIMLQNILISNQLFSRSNFKKPIHFIFITLSEMSSLLLFFSETVFNSWLRNALQSKGLKRKETKSSKYYPISALND